MPNIRSTEGYMNGVWDWELLGNCFGNTTIKPTDIDGFVERKGHFLVIEAKGPTARVPRGQQRMFDALLKTGLFTVIIVWGERNQPERLTLMVGNKTYRYSDATERTLQDVVRWWFAKANGESVVTPGGCRT